MKNLSFFIFSILFVFIFLQSSGPASSTNNKTKIKWGDEPEIGTSRWSDGGIDLIDQDPTPPSIAENDRDQDIVIGTTNFTVSVAEFNEDTHILDYETSSNISYISMSTNYDDQQCCNTLHHTYTFQINGDQPGWVKFKTYIPFNSNHSPWVTANINRKLNTPSISGEPKICSNGSTNTETYTVTADSQSETFTYTVTDGLRIRKNNQNLTTYTGTESSIQIFDYSNTSVKGKLKVKAHASGYVDSNENIKSIVIGVPDHTKLDVYLDGGELLACDYTSADADYDGTAGILEYQWNIPDANDWEILEESGAGPDNKYVEIEYWEDPAPSTEDIYILEREMNVGGVYGIMKPFLLLIIVVFIL